MQQTMHYAITLLSFKLRENITPLNAAIQPRTAVFSADFVSCMECNSICTPVPSWLTFNQVTVKSFQYTCFQWKSVQ